MRIAWAFPFVWVLVAGSNSPSYGEEIVLKGTSPRSYPNKTVIAVPYRPSLPPAGQTLSSSLFEPCEGLQNDPTYVQVPFPKRLASATFTIPMSFGFSIAPEDINYTYLEMQSENSFSPVYDVMAFPKAQISYQLYKSLDTDIFFDDNITDNREIIVRQILDVCGYDTSKHELYQKFWTNTVTRFDGLGDGLVRQYTFQFDGAVGRMVAPNAPSVLSMGGFFNIALFAASDEEILEALTATRDYWKTAQSVGLTWHDALFLEELHNGGLVCHPGRRSPPCIEVDQWTYESYSEKANSLVADLDRAVAFYTHTHDKKKSLMSFLDDFQSSYLDTFRDVNSLAYVSPNHWNQKVETDTATREVIDRLNSMRRWGASTPQWGEWSQGTSIEALSDRLMPVAAQKDLVSKAKNLALEFRKDVAPDGFDFGDHGGQSDYFEDNDFTSEVFADCLSQMVAASEISQENLIAVRQIVSMQSTERQFGKVIVRPPLTFRQQYTSADCQIVASLRIEDEVTRHLSLGLGERVIPPMPTSVMKLLQHIRKIAIERDRYERSLEMGFGSRGAVTSHLATLSREQRTFSYFEDSVTTLIRDSYKSRSVSSTQGASYERLQPPIAVVSNTGDSLKYPIVESGLVEIGRDEKSIILTSSQKYRFTFLLGENDLRLAEELVSKASSSSGSLELSLSLEPSICPILVERAEFDPAQRMVSFMLTQSAACRDDEPFSLPYSRFLTEVEAGSAPKGKLNVNSINGKRLSSGLRALPAQFQVKLELQ